MTQQWFVKRVPMDFDWPSGRIWHGYINPWPPPVMCDECVGTGLNTATKRLHDTFRSWGPKLTRGEEKALLECGPSQQEIARLRARRPGSDSPLLKYQLVEIRAKRKGIWGPCAICNGEQYVPNPNPAVKQLYNGVDLYAEWKPLEPPTGTGWQLWEHAAPEGYPLSPVLESAEALARWCSSTFKTKYEDWLAWAESSGVEKPEPQPEFKLQSDHFKVFVTPKSPKQHH